MKAIGIMGTLAAMMGIDFAMLETIYRLTRKKPRDMSGRQWRKAKRLRRIA